MTLQLSRLHEIMKISQNVVLCHGLFTYTRYSWTNNSSKITQTYFNPCGHMNQSSTTFFYNQRAWFFTYLLFLAYCCNFQAGMVYETLIPMHPSKLLNFAANIIPMEMQLNRHRLSQDILSDLEYRTNGTILEVVQYTPWQLSPTGKYHTASRWVLPDFKMVKG